MNSCNLKAVRIVPLGVALVAGLLLLAGCGGGDGNGGGTPPPPPVANTQSIQVNLGPANNYANGVFTTVTVCVPGTSTCQDIPDVLVDTGSEGLRLLSSQLTVALPQTTSSSGDLYECISFLDLSYVWGPVATADIQMAGEKGSSVPVQIISANPAFAAPSDCTSSGTGFNANTQGALGANGILGVGVFRQDCGPACASSSAPALYYVCPTSGCSVASVDVNSQLQNPVWTFPEDNNGLLITFPSIADTGQATATGTMIFGVGTQSDNAIPSGTTVFQPTDNSGDLSTQFNGTTYSNSTYFDTGSNGLYILDSTLLGVADCSLDPNDGLYGYYCPASTTTFNATALGSNSAQQQITFKIANANTLFSANGGINAAFNDLGGPNSGSFDFGLPFFFGRTVFVGIEGQTSSPGTGPYWAF